MKRIVLCTSSSGLDYLEKPDNIEILRLHILINGKDYLDGKDISYKEMTDMMLQDTNLLPATAPASQAEIEQVFERLYSEGYREVFVLCMSARLSETYNNVLQARDKFQEKMFIHAIDTKSLSYLEALQALEVSKMIKADKNSVEIGRKLDKIRENISLWVVIEDIRNLVKTKRLSAPAGFFANLLDIKPIVVLDEYGAIQTLDKVRRIERALEAMCDNVVDALSERSGQVFIISTGYDEHEAPLREMLAKRGIKNIQKFAAASVSIAVHGPYGIALGVMHDV